MVLGSFRCRDVLLVWIIVGQRPTVLVEDADGGFWDIFSLACRKTFRSISISERVRFRLK